MPERRLLDATELFASLPTDAVTRLREHATGRVAIVNRSTDGRESLVAVLETGGLFGELGVFDGARRSADARALTDSRVIVVPYEPVRAELAARPELLWVVVRVLARRLRATDEALADAIFLDVPARTAKLLLELAGDSSELTLRITQEELAALVGASRERVNRALSMFVRLDWLGIEGRGHYRILDREQLELRATA